MKYWLMKSEPEVFSIDDLKRDKKTLWEGVRNYQARNFMMNDMTLGDQVLFYHSNAEPSGVAGVATVSKLAIPDPTQFQKSSEYFDSKATKSNPRWFAITLVFVQKFSKLVSLTELRSHPDLQEMLVIRKGQRLSIQPVTEAEFRVTTSLGTLAPSSSANRMFL